MIDAAKLVADLERRYVEYVRAVRAQIDSAQDASADYWRWNGAMEAIREIVTAVRAEAGLEPVDMRSPEWRASKGVA